MRAKPLLVILGPTASGKSDLAVEIALAIKSGKIAGYSGAEIISADSRQVYKGLDLGTGKITSAEMKGIPHHLLDVADPRERFTVQQWKSLAELTIKEILSRGNFPIICGGTGYYISALVDGIDFPEVPADPETQKELESRSAEELFQELQNLDPKRASAMTKNGEKQNKRRLARAIIIAKSLGSVPPIPSSNQPHQFKALKIGLTIPDPELKERIKNRLIKRLEAGMVEEARRLHSQPPEGIGLSYERMNELGLEYRYLAEFLEKKISLDQLIETLSTKIWQYAKRQKTWFKRDKEITWFPSYNTLSSTIDNLLNTFRDP